VEIEEVIIETTETTEEETAFGINPETAQRIGSTTNNLAEYGQVFILLSPGLAALVAPLNVMKLVAMCPVVFNNKFVAFLRLFVNFEE
jgi:hypothetical protein